MNQQPRPTYDLTRADQPTNPAALIRATHDSIVYIPGPQGAFIGVPRSTLPADYFAPTPTTAPEPEPTVRTGIDPRAQILTAGGIAAAGTGWGAGQLISAFAGLGTAGLLALALLLLAARMPRRPLAGQSHQGTEGGDHTEIHIHRGGRVKARHLHIR